MRLLACVAILIACLAAWAAQAQAQRVPRPDRAKKDKVKGQQLPPEAPASNDTEETRSVVASGAGLTPDDALKSALVTAVEQAVGVLVDAQTIVDHNDVIQEKIITATNAFVEKYDVLKRWQEGATHHCRLLARIRTRRLMEQLVANRVVTQKTEGRNIHARIVTEENARQGAAEVVKACLADLPQKVLAVSCPGKPVPISPTRLRIPVQIEVDQKVYSRLMQEIEPKLSAIARTKASGVLAYEPVRDGKETRVSLEVFPSPVVQLDPNPVFPPPHVLLAKPWYRGGAFRNAVVKDEQDLLDKVFQKGFDNSQRLGVLEVISGITPTGNARITVYGLDGEAFSLLPKSLHPRIVVDCRLLDAARRELASKKTPFVHSPWIGTPHGFLLTVGSTTRCRKSLDQWPFVGVWPGVKGNDAHGMFAHSWAGHVYVDIGTDDVRKVDSMNLSVRWEPTRD
ncbi:MAG: hypothetical protein BWX88_00380 [Planctomycetes bacterium ADurb.Bin126]|nr:MAG: hypothetical protein BWX88_00380 [Planctomycetes bacterium ADurb.Bin126]HOD81276.1 hypothetical protein [Phycisphaerae bacterium]HQL71604.1 hypothetical protein [Phycisphaerae bacterium]